MFQSSIHGFALVAISLASSLTAMAGGGGDGGRFDPCIYNFKSIVKCSSEKGVNLGISNVQVVQNRISPNVCLKAGESYNKLEIDFLVNDERRVYSSSVVSQEEFDPSIGTLEVTGKKDIVGGEIFLIDAARFDLATGSGELNLKFIAASAQADVNSSLKCEQAVAP